MTSYVLILVMSGSFGGGVSTATFDDLASCMQAGQKFVEMNVLKTSHYDYRCVKKGTE